MLNRKFSIIANMICALLFCNFSFGSSIQITNCAGGSRVEAGVNPNDQNASFLNGASSSDPVGRFFTNCTTSTWRTPQTTSNSTISTALGILYADDANENDLKYLQLPCNVSCSGFPINCSLKCTTPPTQYIIINNQQAQITFSASANGINGLVCYTNGSGNYTNRGQKCP